MKYLWLGQQKKVMTTVPDLLIRFTAPASGCSCCVYGGFPSLLLLNLSQLATFLGKNLTWYTIYWILRASKIKLSKSIKGVGGNQCRVVGIIYCKLNCDRRCHKSFTEKEEPFTFSWKNHCYDCPPHIVNYSFRRSLRFETHIISLSACAYYILSSRPNLQN